MKKPISYNRIPTSIELFGRTINTIDDTARLNLLKIFGEARSGRNEIALTRMIDDNQMPEDELKLTYLHEMLHFILSFTGYDPLIKNHVDLEQFIELLASGIYQYEKSAKYE